VRRGFSRTFNEFFTTEGTETVFSEISSEARDHFGYDGFQANLKEFVAKGIPHLHNPQVRDFRRSPFVSFVVKKEEKQWLQ
jgi:hypothetical protein